ncbi:hypothetical protein P4Y16_32175, partial [Bacillus thuringiensis]|nr:hypothetical protein [Bacillus thuringiensis]
SGIIHKLLPPIAPATKRLVIFLNTFMKNIPLIFDNERTSLVYKKKVAIYRMSRLRNIGSQLFILLTVWRVLQN